jgi:hypothetical protein
VTVIEWLDVVVVGGQATSIPVERDNYTTDWMYVQRCPWQLSRQKNLIAISGPKV